MPKLLFFIAIFSFCAMADKYLMNEETVVFAGHVSRINKIAKLMRVKIDFENSKYLEAKDKVEFWNETYPSRKCFGYVEGRSANYLLLKVPKYDDCIRKVHVGTGTYLHLYSKDLERNLVVAKELVDILLKKRLALRARMTRAQRDVDSFIEKMDTVNKRYEILRQKLELEWKNELSALEEDKVESYKDYKHTQARLNEIEFKLQKYRVRDQNMIEDRWSLDPKLYYKK